MVPGSVEVKRAQFIQIKKGLYSDQLHCSDLKAPCSNYEIATIFQSRHVRWVASFPTAFVERSMGK